MDNTGWAILLGTGLASFLIGQFFRRLWLRRRNQKAQALLHEMQVLARQRQQNEPPALNKAKRRRQQRDQGRRDT